MKRRFGFALWAIALAGCVAPGGSGERFRLTSQQMGEAWAGVLVRAHREAAEQGIDPLWDPRPPGFSAATCRWVVPGQKALCRYRVARGLARPGHDRPSAWEEAELQLTGGRWDFAY